MATNTDLSGKVAVVTGASRGIGADIARVLAREGMIVVCAARTEYEGESRVPGTLTGTVASIVEAGGRAVARRADMSKEDDVHALWDWTVAEFGRVDALINNAAISPDGTVETMNWRHFHLAFQVNVAAPALLSRLAATHMRGIGGGAIINVSSGASRGPGAGPYTQVVQNRTIYGVTKAAIERMTQGMAAELWPDNISVNAIMPSAQIWVGGTIYAEQQRDPEGFDTIDLTGKRRDATIMGDAAAAIIRADRRLYTGYVQNDEQTLTALLGTTDFSRYPRY